MQYNRRDAGIGSKLKERVAQYRAMGCFGARAVGSHDDRGRDVVHRGLVQPRRCTADLNDVTEDVFDLGKVLDNGETEFHSGTTPWADERIHLSRRPTGVGLASNRAHALLRAVETPSSESDIGLNPTASWSEATLRSCSARHPCGARSATWSISSHRPLIR